jgi:hypothetical protein
MPFAASSLAGRLAILALAAAASAAGAQQVYRIVGPDGRVTFSDTPPTQPGTKAAATTAASSGGGSASGGAGLPFELRQVASRYPVTLYGGANCAPCGTGRSFLMARGIPFTEKTISTADDVAALQRLIGSTPSLPVLTVGSQQLKGFSDAEWGQFLDAAGYPKSSRLPAGYRHPPATPLVVAQPAAQPAQPVSEPAAQASPQSAPPPAGSNPAGITF